MVSATVPINQILGKTIDVIEVFDTSERYSHRHYMSKFWAWRMAGAVLRVEPRRGAEHSLDFQRPNGLMVARSART